MTSTIRITKIEKNRIDIDLDSGSEIPLLTLGKEFEKRSIPHRAERKAILKIPISEDAIKTINTVLKTDLTLAEVQAFDENDLFTDPLREVRV